VVNGQVNNSEAVKKEEVIINGAVKNEELSKTPEINGAVKNEDVVLNGAVEGVNNDDSKAKDDLEDGETAKLVGEEVKFDDVIKSLGEFGPYQRKAYFLLFLPTIFSAMHKLSWVFLGAKVDHRCRLPGEDENATYNNPNINLTDYIPWNQLDDRLEFCSMYGVNGSEVSCDNGWIYDRTTFGSSAVMDWNLVCDKKGMKATAQALFMVGVLIGSYGFGYLSDKFGRKKSFFLAVVIQVGFGLLAGIVPEYWSFVLVRMVVGATTSGVFLVAYVLGMEMVGPKYRVVAGTLCQYYYTVGYFVMALIAYFLNSDWQMLELVLTLPTILFISYWWVTPESVRWQIVQGQYDNAKAQLHTVAKFNKAQVSDATLDAMIATTISDKEKAAATVQDSSIIDLLKHPNLRWTTLIMCFNWMVNSGTYYGLSLSASNLGGNPYINFFISAAVEIPAYALNIALLNHPRVGRKKALSGYMLFAGLVLTLTIFVPKSQKTLLISLSMLGKLAITSSYGVCYIFTSELFPTVVRNIGLGVCSMCARVGGILCPYINMLADVWTPIPLIIYGLLALSGGLLALLLPETLGKKLPDTIQEGEDSGKIGCPCGCPCVCPNNAPCSCESSLDSCDRI